MAHSATYRGNEEVEVNVNVLEETELAYKLDIGRNLPIWLPKSLVLDSTRQGGVIISVVVTENTATEKGMV